MMTLAILLALAGLVTVSGIVLITVLLAASRADRKMKEMHERH